MLFVLQLPLSKRGPAKRKENEKHKSSRNDVRKGSKCARSDVLSTYQSCPELLTMDFDSQSVLAIDLRVTAIHVWGAGPNVDVDLLLIVPILACHFLAR